MFWVRLKTFHKLVLLWMPLTRNVELYLDFAVLSGLLQVVKEVKELTFYGCVLFGTAY